MSSATSLERVSTANFALILLRSSMLICALMSFVYLAFWPFISHLQPLLGESKKKRLAFERLLLSEYISNDIVQYLIK